LTCPRPLPGFRPRWLISPSALKADADCPRLHGYGYLEGRRTPDVPFADLPAPPPKAEKGASASAKAKAKAALKAYNRAMRPALGTATHTIFEAYYRQKVAGAWHPPMAWLDLDAAWSTRPGQIALTGREHMPDPKSLERVWCEELVLVAPVPGWEGPWPKLGGTPDLAVQRHPEALYPDERWDRCYHLYDYKTTLSFDYAKTADYLRDDDEQAAIYSLAVMQAHGLDSLDCTWVYMRTEGAPASLPVHFTMSRSHAEARVRALAPRALELEAITAAYVAAAPGVGFLAAGPERRLAIINALPTNDSACANYAGCIYHTSRGGPCKPKKSGLGSALRADARSKQQKQLRREAAKETRDMLNETQKARKAELLTAEAEKVAAGAKLPFNLKQELNKLIKLDEAGGSASDAPKEIETTGSEKTDEAEAASTQAGDPPAKPKPAAKAKPDSSSDVAEHQGITITNGGIVFDLPKTSPLYKPLMAAAKAQRAFAAALAGE
jgi:hypothetical protein